VPYANAIVSLCNKCYCWQGTSRRKLVKDFFFFILSSKFYFEPLRTLYGSNLNFEHIFRASTKKKNSWEGNNVSHTLELRSNIYAENLIFKIFPGIYDFGGCTLLAAVNDPKPRFI